MTNLTLPRDTVQTHVRAGDNPSVLDEIHTSGVEFVIWRRERDPVLGDWADGLDNQSSPHGRLLSTPQDAESALSKFFEKSGVPLALGAKAFMADVKDLATHYSRIANTDLVDIRIGHIVNDACWKFHRDNVALRLISTYSGPGTEYVSVDQSVRALREQRDYDGPIERVPGFGVALFKGLRDSPSGIVHRSPPVAGSGIARLVLCLNVPNSDLDYDIYD